MALDKKTTLHDDSPMPFGKHKGQRLGEVPDSYWRWFLRQEWCDEHPQLVDYANLVDDE
jgi:uncharacterized protein (DUF3820 family)